MGDRFLRLAAKLVIGQAALRRTSFVIGCLLLAGQAAAAISHASTNTPGQVLPEVRLP